MLDDLLQELRMQGSVRFAVRVRPNAPQTRIASRMADASVKIAVAAPAEGGKANAELLKFLAKEFGVPQGNVSVLAGAADRHKIIKVLL